jgi:hypothetical protein
VVKKADILFEKDALNPESSSENEIRISDSSESE